VRPTAAWGVAGVLLALLLIVSIVLSAWYCAFPWSWTTPRAEAQSPPNRDPMTLVYAVDDSTEARRQIEAASARILHAWKTGDAALFASVYALDAAVLEPGHAPVSGKEAIRERMQGIFARDRMKEGSIAVQDVYVLGDHAYATGHWKFAIGPIGKKAKTRSGRFVDIWVREGAGRWMKWRDVGVPG
jgi:uncharacterized protein (TIGR02246 family)